jgi:putative transcriptional regulator
VPVLNPALPAPLNRTQLGRSWPIGPGLRWRPLIAQGGAWGGLLLAQPKRRLPSHGHAGLELTCVISGAFRDGSGIYGAGDLSEPEADHDDPPVVHGDEPCLCVIATEGMRFRGALGWAQRVLLRQ